ncbi:hypothetical protein CGCF415_v002540 [Colletotrichum fructicola]|nr:hypothetical protein CGCFRS4_v011203 [Colletotrichum fructicola]KAF4914124.1 hypothetical protein CGCF415_v002540 [Colletotrichum fructicola]KAF4937678.1 hypothetical protein CGCF245_v005380 [Colletotrichum fructicola]
MLLEKNATADLEDMSTYTTYDEASYGHYKLHDKEVCKVLVAALVDRRTKMLQYALEHLPESEVARFDLRNMSFLKETAFEVGESLKSCTAWVPADFVKVRPGSVYHSPFMTYILAEAMFQAGFHNTDSSWNGCTPLMMQNYNDLADFLRIFKPRIKLMDYTEAEEIRDEDRYLAETLEDLMVEFKPRLSDRTQSFRVFGDYWNKRMDEVNKGKDSISLEEAEECADIGVYLKAQ